MFPLKIMSTYCTVKYQVKFNSVTPKTHKTTNIDGENNSDHSDRGMIWGVEVGLNVSINATQGLVSQIVKVATL